jgi:hypothetical protein
MRGPSGTSWRRRVSSPEGRVRGAWIEDVRYPIDTSGPDGGCGASFLRGRVSSRDGGVTHRVARYSQDTHLHLRVRPPRERKWERSQKRGNASFEVPFFFFLFSHHVSITHCKGFLWRYLVFRGINIIMHCNVILCI